MICAALADPPVVTAHLKPGFTAVSNALVDQGYLGLLTHVEFKLLTVIGRFSTGFLRLHAIIGEQKLMQLTGASRTALYEAKAHLVELGLLVVTHTKTGRCCYRLGQVLQPLLHEEAASTRPTRSNFPPSAPPEGDPSAQPDPYKEFKEIQNQQHPVPAAPVSNDADFCDSSRSQASGVDGTLRAGLVARLKGLGVDEFMAHRLVKTSSAEIITRAIDRLKTLTPTNPAGYLVSEITRGGYRDKIDPHKAQREFHREVHEKRSAERLRDDQQAQKSQEQVDLLLSQFAAMSTELQLEIRQKLQEQADQEGFTRLKGWSEEHPAWRGLLAELLRQNSGPKWAFKDSDCLSKSSTARETLELATRPG